jgi:filamentous hemagglutinin family protein
MNSYSGKKKLKRANCIALVGAILALWGKSALAQSQIVPDETLGDESSQVGDNVEVKGVPSEVIEGGAQQGANLFHSFSEFNVSEGRGPYFVNPAGIEHILGRVTGANSSKILGTLGVLGNADLFLINPNGIIFGENARLDVAGSFVGTTADSVVFDNGFEFSASNPQAPPLLTVNLPMGLQYGNNGGSIQVQGNGQGIRKTTDTDLIDTNEALRVGSDETLALVGGELSLEGATLKTAGGRIELGSVASPNIVSLNPTEIGWALDYTNVQRFGSIRLSQQAAVDASGSGAGDVLVQGGQISLTGNSQIEASTLAEKSGGGLIVKASESVELIGDLTDEERFSSISAQVYSSAKGNGGNIQIETEQLRLADKGQIEANTFGEGNAGNLNIQAQSIEIIGQAINLEFPFGTGLFAQVLPSATGNAGNIKINTEQLRLTNGAQIDATTFGEGNAGNLNIQAQSIELIGQAANERYFLSGLSSVVQPLATGNGGNILVNTEQLRISDGAQITAYTASEGNAGNINIQAQAIELIGETTDGQIGSGIGAQVALPIATGDGGNIQIDTEQLRLSDGAAINSGTFGEGNSGNISIQAQFIELIGKLAIRQGIPSQVGIAAQVAPTATGDGGNIQINTEQLRLSDGALIGSNTLGEGDAGNIIVNAQSIELIGGTVISELIIGSGLNTSVQPLATGDGGNLQIYTDRLLVSDGAAISANTLGQGNAGNLTVKASQLTVQNQGQLVVSGQGEFDPGNLTITADNITLDNQSLVEANTESGSQGNIILNTDNLLALGRESKIRTNATSSATGGNITIKAPDGFIIAVPEENSDISANATQARGGRVFIDTTNLFGIEPREQLTLKSDITASSELGSEFSGTIEINTPDIDPNRGLIQLPTQPIETEVAQACTPGNSQGQSEFFITGRGGLPPNPNETLSSDAIGVDLATLDSDAAGEQRSRGTGEIGRHGNTETLRNGEDLELTTPSSAQPEVSDRIIEAQGMVVDENGEVALVASTPKTTSQSSWQNQPKCYEK